MNTPFPGRLPENSETHALQALDGHFYVAKLPAPPERPDGDFLFYAKTDEEYSLVCRESALPANYTVLEGPFCALRFPGPLDFSLTCILSELLGVLANHDISVFALSTFLTDYVLIRSERFEDARTALTLAGYRFL